MSESLGHKYMNVAASYVCLADRRTQSQQSWPRPETETKIKAISQSPSPAKVRGLAMARVVVQATIMPQSEALS